MKTTSDLEYWVRIGTEAAGNHFNGLECPWHRGAIWKAK